MIFKPWIPPDVKVEVIRMPQKLGLLQGGRLYISREDSLLRAKETPKMKEANETQTDIDPK